MSSLFCLSPAKINLTLQVLEKRKDNYHNIYTIFQKVTLFDEIEIIPQQERFELEWQGEEVISWEKNLIFQAWKLFKETFGIKEELKIKVKKRIPLGAGLGGGSSNSGTFLKILSQLYGRDKKEVFPLALKLGADVPFFLEDFPSAQGEGIGEILTPFPSFSTYYLLIYPGFKVETAWAYQSLNLTKRKKAFKYSPSLPPWKEKRGLINDFKELLFQKYPIYREIEKMLLEEGAEAVNITGTGSTIFGVFEEISFSTFLRVKNFLKGGKIFLVKNLEG